MPPRNCKLCRNGSCAHVGHEMTVAVCQLYVGKTYPELDQLWDEMDKAAMNDRKYSRDDEAVREEQRESEWDAARDMEESDG